MKSYEGGEATPRPMGSVPIEEDVNTVHSIEKT